jgi:uncharacterized membrane protein
MEKIKKIKIILGKSGVILLLILILGLALRLVNLGIQPYWGDEVVDLGIIQHYQGNLPGIIDYFRAVEANPPLYCLLLNFWTKWFGFGEFAVRFLSAIFGLGVILLSYYAGKIIFKNKNVGLLAALITAILPMQIAFSQEARAYIFFCFFGLLAMIALGKYFEKKSWKYLAIYTIAILLGLYLHYSFILFLLAASAFWFFKIASEPENRGRELTRFFIVHGAVFLGFFWWLDALLMRVCLGNIIIFGAARADVATRDINFFDSLFNQLIWLTKQKELSRPEIISIFLFKISFLSAIIYLAGKFSYSFKNLWRDGKFYLVWIFGAVSIFFLFSPQSVNYINFFEKHIIINSVIFSLLFALVLVKINNRKISLLVLIIFAASILNCDARIMADDSLADPYYNLKNVSQYLNQYYQSGDIVLMNYSSGRADLNYYLDKKISVIPIYPTFLLNDDMYYSRSTMGFLESEFQFRWDNPTKEGIDNKLNFIIKNKNPHRVWIYGRDTLILQYFNDKDWRLALTPISDLFPVSLYVKR